MWGEPGCGQGQGLWGPRYRAIVSRGSRHLGYMVPTTCLVGTSLSLHVWGARHLWRWPISFFINC